MKKIFYTATVLATLSVTLFTGCKKDTVAFPDKSQSNGSYANFAYVTPYFPTISDADGIFISAQVTDQKNVIISPYKNEYEYGMVKIASSTGNFSSLIDGGQITLNDTVLTKSSDFSYLSSILAYTLNLSNSINWVAPSIGVTYSLSGASNPSYTYDPANWSSSWAPINDYIDYTKDSVFTHPNINGNTGPIAYNHLDSLHYRNLAYNFAILIYKSDSAKHAKDSIFDYTSQFSIPIKQYTSNADSVYITMMDNNGYVYRRVNLSTDSISDFTPVNFYKYFNGHIPAYDISTFRLEIDAIKFNNAMIATKKYYFLKMASYIKYNQASK